MMPAMDVSPGVKAASRDQAPSLVHTLQAWPWLEAVRTLHQRFREDRLGITASSLTFTTLISLVPLLTVVLAVFAVFPLFARFQDALQQYFLKALVPDTIARPVLTALTQFADQAKGVGGAGFVFLFFSVLALMLTIDRTLNAIWRVRQPRPIGQRVLVYWTVATLGPLMLGISLSLTSYAISASEGFVHVMPGGLALLLALLDFALLVVGLAGLFHYVPNVHVRWRHAIAGAAFSAFGFELVKRLLGWYLAAVPTYSMVYGAFATVPIFLIWIYLAWVSVLLGAVIAAYAPSLQTRVKRWPDVPGARFLLATALLGQLVAARVAGERGLSLARLSAGLRCGPLQIEPLLELLVALDWVGRLDEVKAPRFVLLCDPAATPAQPLLSQLLLDRSAAAQTLWRRAGFDTMTLQMLLEPRPG